MTVLYVLLHPCIWYEWFHLMHFIAERAYKLGSRNPPYPTYIHNLHHYLAFIHLRQLHRFLLFCSSHCPRLGSTCGRHLERADGSGGSAARSHRCSCRGPRPPAQPQPQPGAYIQVLLPTAWRPGHVAGPVTGEIPIFMAIYILVVY